MTNERKINDPHCHRCHRQQYSIRAQICARIFSPHKQGLGTCSIKRNIATSKGFLKMMMNSFRK